MPNRLNSMLINRDFARLWYGQATSNVGDYAAGVYGAIALPREEQADPVTAAADSSVA